MKESRLIGARQFTILVIFFGIGSSILIAPGPLTSDVKQDAWISALLGAAASLIPISLYMSLVKRYPEHSLIEMNELVFGKWLGKGLSLLYIWFFIVLCALLLGDIGYFLTTQVLPETPIDAIMAGIMIVVVMGVRLGPEVMARSSEIFFPWVIILFSVLVLLLLPQTEIERMQPVMENGVAPLFKAALPFTSLQEYVVLLMIVPYVKMSEKRSPSFYLGAVIAGLAIFVIVLLCILVLGPGLTSVNMYPSFTLAKKISVGKFLERMEVVIGGLWFITITFKLMMTFYAASLGLSQLFKFPSYSFLTWPLAMLMVPMVLVSYTNIVFVIDFLHRAWPAFAFTFMLVLPALTWVVALFRRK